MRFLIQSPHAWRGVWQRPHHLATQFAARGHHVDYVEPRYLRWLLNDRDRFFQSRSETISDRIEVSSVTLLNGERFGLIRSANQRRLANAFQAKLKPRPPSPKPPTILWLYNPHEVHLIDSVPHDLLVYDIMDEYRGFPWSPRQIAEEEARLLKEADCVFAGTAALYESKRSIAEGKIECVLSGVDVDHFQNRGTAVPEDMKALRSRYSKLFGYAGMIDLRIDQPLLIDAARRHPDWGWVLVGPILGDLSALQSAQNIHLLGSKRYTDLPAYYHAFDCALIPFVENELTRHINPTKILEYAAAGLPIVSRALPDVEKFYSAGAFLYRTPEEFERHLQTILGKNQPEEASRLVSSKLKCASAWSDDRSWPALAERMLKRVEQITKPS